MSSDVIKYPDEEWPSDYPGRELGMKEISVAGHLRHVVVEEKPCPICGTIFAGPPVRRYCSTACSKRADYLKHVEKRRANRRERYRQQKHQSEGHR